MTRYFKVLDGDNKSMHGGTGRWEPGEWREVDGELVPCVNGLHLCRPEDLVHWLGPVIWEAGVDGEVVEAGNKVVARRARITRRVEAWNERTARLFAADCAEDVLHLIPEPQRAVCAATIAVARRHAGGLATDEELAAARSAAWDVAWDAARSAASAAASAAARAAAWDVAGDAARSAASAAASDAAWAAARKRQTARLLDLLEATR